MNEVKRFQWQPIGMRDVERVNFYRLSTWVDASDFDAKAAECAAVIQDCRILCNALQRIEAGEAEPRMIARRTLEHWSEKSALEKKL